MDGQGTYCRRNIAENLNRLSRAHERDRQTTDRRQYIANEWLTDINLLLILTHQMVALVRRALAEVYTVPVLLIFLPF